MLRLLSSATVLTLALCLGPATAAANDVGPPAATGADVPSAGDDHAQAPGFPWQWPVAGAREVVEPFRAPAHDYGPGHRGMDIAAGGSAEVVAPAAGVVAFRGAVVDRALVTIDHGGGYVTTWEPVSSELSPGDAIARGQVIGVRAQGGHAPGGTLHVGVRVDGEYANPLPLFGQIPRAVLLPCCE